jgi:hypothetical protein
MLMRIIMSRRTRWVGYVAHLGEILKAYRILVENQKERGHWEDLAVGVG